MSTLIHLCELFWNRKRLRVQPEMHYSICAMSSAQLHNWCVHVHESKCGSIFHPALEPKYFGVPLWLQLRRSVVWPSVLHFWSFSKGEDCIASNYWHWSRMMGLIPTKRHSSVVLPCCLSEFLKSRAIIGFCFFLMTPWAIVNISPKASDCPQLM